VCRQLVRAGRKTTLFSVSTPFPEASIQMRCGIGTIDGTFRFASHMNQHLLITIF